MSWPTTPTRFILTEVDERGLRDGENGELLSVSEHRGVVPRRESASQQAASEDVSHYKRCEPGQLVLNKLWAFRGGLGVSTFTGLVSPAYAVYNIDPSMDPRFVHYQTRSAWFVSEMTKRLRGIGSPDAAVGRAPHLNTSELGRIRMWTPSLDRQRRIADVLDAETARIDTLIGKNERVLGLLKARAVSVVASAITSPEAGHWGMIPVRYALRRQRQDPLPGDAVVTAFRSGRVCLRTRHRSDGFTMAEKEHGYQHVGRGNLVVHSMDAFAGAIGVSEDDGKMSPVVHIYTAGPYFELDLEFVAHYLRNLAHTGYIEGLSRGIRERSTQFDASTFARLKIPIPSLAVQQSVCKAIEASQDKMNSLRFRVDRQQELLRLRRQSLITAAVTGQIEV